MLMSHNAFVGGHILVILQKKISKRIFCQDSLILEEKKKSAIFFKN
jgi:hypothetical protein